ncbi:hypothetical protein J4468_00135 [Candidatus Woesearchaeota archaeon]|nr:hypothetical protein [Candidatus Woesearchaeota archaeon]
MINGYVLNKGKLEEDSIVKVLGGKAMNALREDYRINLSCGNTSSDFTGSAFVEVDRLLENYKNGTMTQKEYTLIVENDGLVRTALDIVRTLHAMFVRGELNNTHSETLKRNR